MKFFKPSRYCLVNAPIRSGSYLLPVALCAIALAACGRTYVAEEVPSSFELPAGVALRVDLVNPSEAADIEVGEPFAGTLAEPLYYSRQKLDPEGETFTEETLIAPIGAPVAGVGVALSEDGVGLQLESVTFHGGMSFPVETAVLIPPATAEPSAPEGVETEEVERPLTFVLNESADVALAIDYRDNENSE